MSLVEGEGSLEAEVRACFGVNNVDDVTFEDLDNLDSGYAQCLNGTGVVEYRVLVRPFPFPPAVVTSSPCGGTPEDPSSLCCSAVDSAVNCQLSPGSGITENCKELLDDVIFKTYECQSLAKEVLGLILLFGILLLIFVVGVTCMRHYPFGALLRKNMILRRQSFISNILAQAFSVGLLGILAYILLDLTGTVESVVDVPFLGISFELSTPDSNRTLIYQNLRPFGGLFILIVFTYAIASMIVSVVAEKETRMNETLRMAGMDDFVLISSWIITFMLQFLPTVLGTSVVTKYGSIFPNQSFREVAFFFTAFLFSMIGFCFLLSVFFSKTRPAAVTSICIVYLLLFSSFFFVASDSLSEQRRGCLIAPVCLSLGVNTMLDDASLGTGFARAAAFEATNRDELLLSVDECMRRLVLDGFLYLLAAWYLEKVLPQEVGVRRRPDFVLQPAYPYFLKAYAWIRAKIKGEEIGKVGGDSCGPANSEEENEEVAPEGDVEQGDEGDEEWAAANAERTKNTQVVMSNLCKTFRINGFGMSSRKAVDDLSLTLNMDEVTVILGPNGAGKTTTIGVLTGIYQPTSGDAVVFGHSIRTEMHKVRQLMGWCPQHDILYPTLTVKQHLELFAALRGKRLDMGETKEMLKELAIFDKLNAKSKTLSGGQRRKLCLAMALIGDTKICFLDEVTAGVDPTSRRACWNVIQNNRKGRAIVLTTHFMDEADVLGDRIAIMANGKLCAEGTSLELKQEYGDGYTLVVGMKKNLETSPTQATQAVFHEIPDASIGSSKRSEFELEFRLPFDAISSYPKLLRRLQHELNCEVSISITTLEDVFLKVAAMYTNDSLSLEHLQDTLPYVEKKSPRSRAFWALLIKRVHYARRDLRACMLVLLLPILFCIGLLVIPNIRLYGLIFPGEGTSAPALTECEFNIPEGAFGWATTNANPATYPLVGPPIVAGRTCCPQPDPDAFNSASDIEKFQECIETLPQCVDVSDPFSAQESCYFGLYHFCWVTPWLCDVKECCDPRNRKSPYYLCQPYRSLDETFLFLEDETRANYNDFCQIRDFTIAQEYVNSFIRTLVVLLGFIFPSASVIAFAVLEKEPQKNTKFQQIVNGVRKFTFWLSAFVFDSVVVVLPVLMLPIVLSIMYENALSVAAEVIFAATLLTFSFVFSCVSLAYAMSFAYNSHARALIGIIIFQIITGGALSTITYILEVVPLEIGSITTSELVSDYLRYILGVFPGYAFADGLIRLQTQRIRDCGTSSFEDNMKRCTTLFDKDEVPPDGPLSNAVVQNRLASVNVLNLEPRPPFSYEDTLISVGYLVGMGLLFWLIVILIELNILRLYSWCCCCRRDALLKQHKRRVGREDRSFLRQQGMLADEVDDDDDEDMIPNAIQVAIGEGEESGITPEELMRKVAVAQEVSQDYVMREQAQLRLLRRQASFETRMIDQGVRDVEDEKIRVQSQTADAIQVLDLTKRFPNKLAVDHLWFGVKRGEVFGTLGVNGAGKSTTINMLLGAIRPTSGTASIMGNSIRTKLARARRSVGYCPQHDALYDLLTVREHLIMYARVRGIRDIDAAVSSAIVRMQLTRFSNVISKQLSGGNKRKLSAAIAMLGSPPVVILDEPSSGVDPASQRYMWEVIRDTTTRTNSAVMLVSHSMPEVEALSNRIGIMIDGRLRCIGTATYLKSLYGSSFSVEIILKQDTSIIVEPAGLENGYVTPSNLRQVCESLGVPQRYADLQSDGSKASSIVAFALNTPTIAKVRWREFARWWVQEDAFERLKNMLEEKWGGPEAVVVQDRQRSYVLFNVSNPALQVADMFELLEYNQVEFFVDYYSISTTGLEEIFHSVVESAENQNDPNFY